MMREIALLWVDDEIDLLRPHILFLQSRGYKVYTATNGDDALSQLKTVTVDLVFLDENMPGKSGIELVAPLKQLLPGVPLIMITKSEEENIMDEAIGSKIDDYLIKPVNPNQVLLTIKKHIDTRRLISSKTTSTYQSQFSSIGVQINNARSFNDWTDIYKKLVYWELELERAGQQMSELLKMQKIEANNEFAKYIKINYPLWFKPDTKEKPILSPAVFSHNVLPLLEQGNKVLMIIIDNLRFDQWQILVPSITDFAKIEKEDLYFSILPTATQYARNALFAGLMPLEIQKLFPKLWVSDEDEEAKNLNEEELLNSQMNRIGKGFSHCYEKINNQKAAKKLTANFSNLKKHNLVVTVFNFVDILSHARTETEVVKELAVDEPAYRSITLSWFQHSALLELIHQAIENKMKVVITTDHGTIRVTNPVKVIGDRRTSSNLRYKLGRNLNYNPKEVFEVKRPADVHLPGVNLTSTYIFATNYDYLVYPNNYNQFVNYYKNTFQHGGVSMEEMMIPFIILSSK
jgi:DNA-binding response OmpR family regulator